MLHYFRLNPGRTFIVSLMTVLCSLVRVSHGVLLAYILNAIVAKNMQRFVLWTVADFAVFTLLGVLLFSTSWLRSILIQKMSTQLRLDIAQNVTSGDYAFFHRHDTGTYGSWLTNDITMIESQGFACFFLIIQLICDTGFTIVAFLQFHWSLIVISFLLALATYGVPQLLHKQMAVANLNVTHANEKLLARAQSLFKGFDTLFSLDLQRHIPADLKEPAEALAQAQVKESVVQAGMNGIAGYSSIISQITLTAWTGLLVLWGLTSIGTLDSVGNLSFNILNSMAQLGPVIVAIQAVQPLFAKYVPAPADPQAAEKKQLPPAAAGPIQLTDLTYTYPGSQKTALRPITVTIAPTQKVAVTGPSGVGKSTLLNILNGKLTNYQGAAEIAHIPLQQINSHSLRRTLLYIDQLPYVFAGTVRDNMNLGEHYSDKQIMTALQQADLAAFVQELPAGLDTPVGEDGRLFSGGQRQRLALARGMLRQRHIMLIDEGTSALDRASALTVENSFLKQADLTVIFVTHQLHDENKALFDQVIQLS